MIRVILVRPEQPRNIGAVLRAAANFGAESVQLVAPVDWNDEAQREARVASSGAWDLLQPVVGTSIEVAAGGCDVLVGTTARRRDHPAEPITAEQFFADDPPSKIALLFGPESQGLSVTELNLCHRVITIPTAESFPSLNLAQAVLIVLYEAFRQTAERPAVLTPRAAAPLAEQEALIQQLLTVPTDAQRERAAAQFRHWLHRSAPTTEELAALRLLLKS